MDIYKPLIPTQTIMGNTAIAALTLAILSFLSPQIGMLGHGLRTTLPALMVSFLLISCISPLAFFKAFIRFRGTFLLGFIFLIQAALRFMDETYKPETLWQTFFTSPLLALLFLFWIAALAELGDDSIHRLRCWLLFGWCLSIAVSLPLLISHPGIARTTMGNRNELFNAAKWAPHGVAEYTVYTTIGICVGPLFAVTKRMKFFWRWMALLLILMTGFAVLISTFTMAAVMLAVSLLCMLLVWAMAGRGVMCIVRILVILFPLAMLQTVYVVSKNFEQTKFVVTKVERLTEGISKKGLAKGDETSRGEMFTKEMKSFFEEPFIGYIPGVTGQRGYDHSSLSNSLVLFGLLCTPIWVIALYKVFRSSAQNARDQFERNTLKVAWLVFVLSGILNPIWHSSGALGALFALTLPVLKMPTNEKE